MSDFLTRARETAEREVERAMPLTGGPADGMRKSSWEIYGMGAAWAVSRLPGEGEIADLLGQHQLSVPNGGTASWAWCDCSCGHQERMAGVTREYAFTLALRHQARAVRELIEKKMLEIGRGGE